MRNRAWHSKSRKGCKACKIRRVKCDQTRPVCGHCARLYNTESCEYEILGLPPSRPHTSPPSRSNTPASSLGSERPTDFDRRRDARLLYQWYSSTSRSLPSHYDPDNVSFWSNTVSMWATEHEFVLDAIMAMAAMHLISEDPQKNSEYREVSMLLMNAAIAEIRQLSGHVDKTIAEPLMAASILTAFQYQIMLGYDAEEGPYRLPLEQFEFQRGLMAVYNLVRPYMAEDSYLRRVNQLEAAKWQTGLPLDQLNELDEEVRKDADMLLAEISNSILHSDEAKYILQATLSYIMAIEYGLKSGEPHEWTRRRAATMPSRIPEGYISLVKQQDLLALSILIRYYVLFKLIDARDSQWWGRGIADRHVLGTASLVSKQSRWLIEPALNRAALAVPVD